jgi:hypothetical protein
MKVATLISVNSPIEQKNKNNDIKIGSTKNKSKSILS